MLHRGQPVVGVAVFGCDGVEPLLLGEVLGPVLEATELGVDLGQFEQRTLLRDFGFHTSASLDVPWVGADRTDPHRK